MKIWFKIWENTHLLKSETIEDDTEDTRTHKIFHALEEVCLKWDLGKPIWFDANIAEFQRHARTRFGKDNFVEETEFDYNKLSACPCYMHFWCRNTKKTLHFRQGGREIYSK